MDRLARRAILILVFLLLLPCGLRVLAAFMSSVPEDLARGLPRPHSLLTTMGAIIALTIFSIGLIVRLSRWFRQGSPVRMRLRERERRAASLAERRPAEDVPIVEDLIPHPADDPDPSLPWNEG